jgi:UDP-glucuronate 4-epimerase
MSTYLVTGGAGFIGSNLIRTVLRDEPEAFVVAVDNFDPFYPRAFKELNLSEFRDHPRFRLVEADIAEVPAAELAVRIPERIDVIVHLAGKAGVRPSIEAPEAYLKANIVGLQRVLDFARAKGVPQFVFASSSSVYGVSPTYPWKEADALLPISPYAATKQAGELMGHVYHKLYGLRFLALRFFTVYGPGQRPDLAICKFSRALLEGKPIPMFGDGSMARDYTFVDDTVRGIRSAMAYTGSGYEVVNLGNNRPVLLRDLIAALETAFGRTAAIERLPEQPGDVPVTYADISKAERLFGYRPRTEIADGLRAFRTWLETHRGVLMG